MLQNSIICCAVVLFFSFISPTLLFSQPSPGDIFREYSWTPTMVAEQGKILRVGGRMDYKTDGDHFPASRHKEGHILFGKYINLESAVRAELMLEKIGSHEGTTGLRVSINHNPSIEVPVAKKIPEPQSDYMHHTYPVVQVPLEQLNEGWENTFRLDVDTIQPWNWPQNLINGIILRVYYDDSSITYETIVTGILPGGKLNETVVLGIDNADQGIRQVDYIAWYEGINFEGDGNYRQWHYNYLRGRIINHIGSVFSYPYSLKWNTSWVPDQKEEIMVAARIVDNTGLTYFTEPIGKLKLDRDYSVELCKPYDQPKNWATREREFESKVDITGEPEDIIAARLYWTSWSPCYSNGIYINNVKVFDKDGPCYEYMAHEVALNDFTMLKRGTNIIKTGKTPLDSDGEMVHGMEVQWPGIMLLVKYK